MTVLNTLDGPDGSATYSSNGYSVVAAVNGPIEVSRRDEQAEEATLEVNVRPAIGVGSPRDRYLELLLHSTLSRIITMDTFPRSLLQLTLQVLNTPAEPLVPKEPFATSLLLFLVPALLNAAQLALIAGAVPLRTTISVLTALHLDKDSSNQKKSMVVLPLHDDQATKINVQTRLKVTAVHVFAVTGNGELVLAESEGDFSFDEWEAACTAVKDAATAIVDSSDNAMILDDPPSLAPATSTNARKWLLDITRKPNQAAKA